ncbi:hypothetical protein OIU77_007839 [Salix suchowensis]|uniref:Glycine-rich protein n=1 Tax=Salix suchowensis TaxID=1278906 RepID=A0ABQ9AHI7_9ROSI|nr:hypothetical protein OIU77_007839 [Salix suchowensis]
MVTIRFVRSFWRAPTWCSRAGRKGQDEHTGHGRKIVELNDYPGSGANNRHTPRPQFGRCADC